MFGRKQEKWFEYCLEKPQVGVNVLFCDYNRYWIGKVLSTSIHRDEYTVFTSDEHNILTYDSNNSTPIFWRYLPNMPERKNPCNLPNI